MRKEVLAEGVELYLGDCREILPTLVFEKRARAMALAKDSGIKWAGAGPERRAQWLKQVGEVAIVTDPPYGIDENSRKVASRGKLATPKDYGAFDWDKEPPPAWLIAMIRDISRYQVIFGGNYYELPPTSCWLVWDKKNGTNDFSD